MILVDRYWISSKSTPDDEVLLCELYHTADSVVRPDLSQWMLHHDNIIRFEQIEAPFRAMPFVEFPHG